MNVPGASPVADLTAATVSIAFVFEGWILSTSINSELRDAKKNMPKALIISAVFIVAIYIAYFLGICGSIPVDDLMASSSTAAFIRTFGSFFGRILNVFIFISCLCTTHGLMIANARNIYSIAVRGQGPHRKVFAHVDPATKMPINSTLFGTMISMVWLVYFFGANVLGNWFGVFAFDSSERPIVNLYAFYIPIFIRISLTGPTVENNVKNNIENADAIIRFGRYITVLKNLWHLSRRLGSENQAANKSERIICGIKPMIHMIMVFLKYTKTFPSENSLP